ncbi:MAG TPA: PKD domain-containing protein [Pyrinomonadaceae bacterium]|nr:PKD domain-containing protein [Pyrinomonadaceae bacterium]
MGNTTVTTNVWHHVAGVFDGSQMRVYLDGALDGSLSTTNGPGSGTSSLNIGKSTYTTYYFGGLIDEVRISATAIYSSNFIPGLPPVTNTRALWKFDGQTTNDSSGNGNHGTLQNGATYSTNVPSPGSWQTPVSMPNGPYAGQRGQSITFSSSGSFDPNGTITAYYWNFGDGTSSSSANPAHTYQTSGLFTATLTVTDNSGLLSSATTLVNVNGSSEARLDPRNATGGSGENPLSRNFTWTLPLVSLPGRAGLDLDLSLSYNSLVWTKKGTTSISFDDDYGFPSPGFRLGFPTIQTEYLNPETGKSSFLLIGSDGSRTELRRVTSVLYESADSSHLLLDTTDLTSSDPMMVLITTDGTRLTYKPKGAAYECTQIKDRNGNFITIDYNSSGRIANIRDTLDRTITFVYDNGWLMSIEQQWKKPSNPSQSITHTWASFAYTNVTIQTNFASGIAVSGPTNGLNLKMLSKVTLADNSTTPSENAYFDFAYTSWGQVWKISNFAADNHLLNYRSYNLPLNASSQQSDCPRFTERRDWVEKWNQDVNGTEQEAVTTFTDLQSGTANVPNQNPQAAKFVQVTNPDQTFTRIYFLGTAGSPSGWRVGLPYLVDSYDAGGTTPQRQVETAWTQDDESKSFIVNPRVLETNIYDASGNRKRTGVQYQSYDLGNGMTCKLPLEVREYNQTATTILRTTRTIYIDDSDYLSRRLIGLPKETYLYEGVTSPANLKSKREFKYDEPGSIDGNDAPVQHDPAYSSTLILGRGNLTTVKRFDVDELSQSTSSTMKYNTAGSLVSSKNALNQETRVSYSDSFSDAVSRNTLAYPTGLTDPDGYYSLSKYNFDFGAITSRKTPPPNFTGAPTQQPAGPEQVFEYYDYGRLKKQLNVVNGAYTMYVYEANGIRINVNSTIQDDLGEAHSFTITDGAGRVIATALDNPDNPGKTGAFRAQRFVFNVMGRLVKSSNPAETDASGNDPAQWTTTDHDEVSNWIYTQQSYDWKGRPTITTNVDGTTKLIEYTGCGCAGGDVVTLKDEGTLRNGVNKRRLQKIYSDVLGRPVKSETWNFEGTAPDGVGRKLDSTTVTSYNARDQVTMVRQFAGAAPTSDDGSCPTGLCQKTEFKYDGYGRIKSQHAPEQNANAVTAWTYNPDDSLNTVTDGRGSVTTFGYAGTNRGLVKSLTHALAGKPTISLAYNFDAAGNRLSMTQSIDGSPQDSIDYVYNQLSQLTAETKHINALDSNSSTHGYYTINYQYTLSGNLKTITDPFNAITTFNYDATGRTQDVSSLHGGVNFSHVNNVGYRAWGAVRNMNVGGLTETRTYNRRLLPTQYRYSQHRYDYTYHNDGKLKELIDLDDQVGSPSQVTFHYMSRQYVYDHVGRISGVQGRDNINVPAPFVGNYTFDEFGNMKQRSGHYALNPDTTDNATYVNNRRVATGWDYDQDGRLKTSADTNTSSSQTWTYDARGKPTTIIETISPTTITNTLRHDGNGDLVFESVSSPSETKSNYLINSTVLGSVLTKLDGNGNKDITYIPVNGLTVAVLGKDLNGNPSSGHILRDASGLQEGGKAYDPFGALIHNVQPPVIGPPPNMPFFGATYGGVSWNSFTNANNLSTGCTLDGARTSCQKVLNALGKGNADLISLSTTGTQADFLNTLGFIPQAVSHRRWVNESSGLKPDHSNDPNPEDGVIVINTDEPKLGHWEEWEEYIGGGMFDWQEDTRPVDTSKQYLVDDPKGFPCPPTMQQVLNGKRGKQVASVLNATWKLAQQTNREEGGWIYMNRAGRFMAVPKDRNTMWDAGDDQTKIELGMPPRVKGWRVIGTFHTHDSNSDPSEPVPWGQDSMGRRLEIAGDTGIIAEQGVPGIILGGTSPSGVKAFTPYGPPRGFMYYGLPRKCK